MSHHILIVDDQQDLALMLADLLADAGYETRIADDGQQARGATLSAGLISHGIPTAISDALASPGTPGAAHLERKF